ncbi:MAG: dihydroneopterin aldolase [Pseudomonadota bacterium]|nr:dihydroneopterin aldolase [Pseudomonadota bacterium]
MSVTLPQAHRCIVVSNLRLPFLIGIYEHEKKRPQEVLVTIHMFVPERERVSGSDIADHVSYGDVVRGVKAIAASGRHIPLVENLAEEIADVALADARVARVVVDVRKTQIIPEAEGVGVIIERSRD